LWLRTSLPTTKGTVQLTGPESIIEIFRDAHGVPHIHAASQRDAYFALGFVHAQDRLWQMELMRRTASGRLAEMGGARLLPHDRAMRTLGLARLSRNNLKNLSAPVKAALAAYTQGINSWLDTHSGALPPEFYVAGVRPTPWKAEESLLWGRLMGLRLSTNWRREALRAQLLRRLAPAKVAALWPPYPADAPVTVTVPDRKSERPLIPSEMPWNQVPDLPFNALAHAIPAPLSSNASNSWAVSGRRTVTGKPILAGDPHLGFRAPNLWYLARITAPGLTLAGATLPGVPFHVFGHNQVIGWTMTTTGADTQDLVIERPQPGDAGRYLTPDGSRAFITRTETIDVKGGAPVRLTVRATHNGPVVSDLMDRATTATQRGVAPSGALVALKATVLASDDRTAEALYHLNRAQNWKEFRTALRSFHSPVQNVMYSDVRGRIGFQVAGRVPIRRSGDGFAPVRGVESIHDWIGYIPFDRLPTMTDPRSGLVINANNRVVGPGYRHLITRDWATPYRARRIQQKLAGDRRHSVAASAAMQMDNLSLAAREIIPVLLATTPRTPETGGALDRLGAWDGKVLRTKSEPLIFNAWLRKIGPGLVADELGPLAGTYRRADPLFIKYVLQRDRTWCDDVSTPAQETCASILEAALVRALEDLRQRFGPDMSRWRWGDAHIARFRNRALSSLPLIGSFAHIEIATDGDTFTLNRGTTRRFSRRNPFAHGHGATLRAIYDFADLDRSLFIQPTGQSGNPLSPHYRDLIQTWRDGGYLTIPSHLPAGPHLLRLEPTESTPAASPKAP
jgi:penicillin amidase